MPSIIKRTWITCNNFFLSIRAISFNCKTFTRYYDFIILAIYITLSLNCVKNEYIFFSLFSIYKAFFINFTYDFNSHFRLWAYYSKEERDYSNDEIFNSLLIEWHVISVPFIDNWFLIFLPIICNGFIIWLHVYIIGLTFINFGFIIWIQ